MMKLQYTGRLTAGYFNDMENGSPVFIDGKSLSDLVTDLLAEVGEDTNFCFGPFEDASFVKNPLVGKQVTLTLEIGS